MGEFLKSKIGQDRYDAVMAYLYSPVHANLSPH